MILSRWKSSIVACLLVAWGSVTAEADTVDFNRDVRPIFNEHCVACHGGVKQAADLSFVYGDAVAPLLEPGDPEGSYLLERIVAEDEAERMPPPEHGRRLNEAEVEVIRAWIRQGAKWGNHWAFDRPRKHEPLVTPGDRWSRGRVDRFVLPRLRAAGLNPAPEATPERWLRRVTLDLTGLPPTPAEREAFLAELQRTGEAAYEAVVDRLLMSPALGERWASVWLDAVRYADSRGLGQDGRRSVWKYRDWVISAINDDLPYDQFTIRQLAGDLLPDPTMDDLVATTCQRLTQTNEEGGTDDEMFRVEAVIDRVNTLWQTWQGVSFGCVQCHAHPYDPIRHEEYYRFLAFFNNSADCDLTSDLPRIDVPVRREDVPEATRLDEEIRQISRRRWDRAAPLLERSELWQPLTEIQASTNNDTKVVVAETDGVEEYQTRGTVAKQTTVTIEAAVPNSIDRLTAIRFTGFPEDQARAAIDSEWGFVISHFAAEKLAADGQTTELTVAFVLSDEPDPLIDPQRSLKPKDNQGFGAYSRIHYPRSAAFVLDPPVEIQPGDRLRVSLAQNVFELGAFPLVADRGRVAVSGSEAWTEWWNDPDHVADRERLGELRKRRAGIPSVATPVMAERPDRLSRPTHVFDRGNYLTKADPVQPNVPEFLPDVEPGRDGKLDRLDMARWLVDPQNPLTSRVAVNRVWSQLFGVGLVETQEDFGSAGEPPSHPQLLDDLAARFQTEMGWSLKSLLRELVLTATYRQSPKTTPQKLEVDPRNRLLSRGPHQRLPAETIRDQALAIGGLLSREPYGPPVHPPLPEGVWNPFQGGDKWETPSRQEGDRYRRTIYTYTKRTIPYPVMAAFDAPSREFCSPRRLRSNTPLQALMTLNDATFVEAAQGLARRMRDASDSVAVQLRHGFLVAVCREPTSAEQEELMRLYRRGLKDGPDAALQLVASVLLNLDEVLTK